MGRFKDRYDELFGATPPYDPIELRDRTEQRADTLEETAPTASPERAIPLYEPDFEMKRGPDDSGFLENMGRQFGAGVVQVGEMGLGAAEYAARSNYFLDGIVADTIYSGRSRLGEVREDILAGISEDDRQKAAAELLTLDPDRTIWQGNPLEVAEAVLYKTANALPATMVTMIPAIRWARAASPGTAVAYMGASEGVMSTGAIANSITDEIMSIPTEQLLQESPRFAELLEATGGNADDARDQLIQEAQGFAPLVGGATVAAISATAGRYFTPVFEKGGGAALGSRVARGFAAEAPQEASQGGAEQLVQNYAARIYDLDRQLSEGVGEAMAQEGLIGGLMGAGAGGMLGQRPTPAAPPPDPNAPPGQMDLPGIEPGGPETLPDELDQPMPEPQGDIEAQIADLQGPDSPRQGVYLAPGTDERLVASIAETLPEELVFTRNVDGRGGHLITKNARLGLEAQRAIANGTSRQAVIGRIVGAGVGKPTSPTARVVQLLDDQGMVARESMVANQQEAEDLGVEWSKEKGNKDRQIIVLTPEEAIERREVIGDAPADYGVQKDLFDDQPARPPATIPPPEGGQQLDLPLTRGRERGRGRVPMPTQQEYADENIDEPYNQLVGRPIKTFPEEEPAGVDPFEVSRRQDDMFEGEAPFEPTIQDEVQDDIRSTVPFEEREGAYRTVKGARSLQQAAESLTGEAAATYDREQQERIGGFYNPDRLTFDNPEYETAYRTAWDQLVDEEIRFEMTGTKTEKRGALLKELGKIRQVAKPKRSPGKSESLIRAAQRVSPAVQKELREKARMQNEPDPGPRPPGTATPQRDVGEDYLGEFTAMTREEIDALEGRDLDEAFERAVVFREGREADTRVEDDVVGVPEQEDTEPKELSGELKFQEETKETTEELSEVNLAKRIDRSKYRTPGQRKKFIRREAEHARRRDTGQRSVKATPIRRSASASKVTQKPGESEGAFQKRRSKAEERKKFDTAPLTQENYKLDESVEDRVKRIAEAKKVRTSVGKSATKARAFLRKLKGKTRTKGMDDKTKANFLYARNYLEQLIQFARSIQKSKSESTQTIKLAKGVEKMLDTASTLTDEQFANRWGAVAKQNEFDDLANLKFTSLASMRDPKARAKATRESNNAVAASKRLRVLADHLRGDQLYQNMIGPVLRKMSNYVLDNVGGRASAPYIPNEMEIAELKYAMQTLKNNWSPARLSDMGQNMQREFAEFATDKKVNIYEPLRAQMERIGFQFNESGNMTGFEATEEYLGPRFRDRFKGQQEKSAWDVERGTQQTIAKLMPESAAPTVTQRAERDIEVQTEIVEDEQTAEDAVAALDRRKKELAGKVKPGAPAARVRTPGPLTVDTVNSLISRFQKATSTAKTTISGIKRAEARFIRGLKKIGAWRQTGNEVGVIDVPGVKTRVWRMVSPRLDAKTMRKDKARAAIQRIAQFPIPKSMIEEVEAARDETPAGVENFLSENDLDLVEAAIQPIQYDAEYTGVAERIGEMLTQGIVRGNDVINTILEIAPQNSFYRNLANQLANRDVGDVKAVFGTQEDFPRGQPGKFNRKSNTIFINRDVLNMDRLGNDSVYGARVVHTMTHELVHAQTHISIDNNASLRGRLESLQRRARDRWKKRVGGNLPYGLKVLAKSENEVHEFIAEAFSNHEFQQFLKETPQEAQTIGDLWRAFVNVVREILGLPVEVPNNLFNAIMMTEDVLFDDAGFGGVAQGDLYMTGEAVIDNVSTFVQELSEKAIPVVDKLKTWGRNLMTFEQLHDAYADYFTNGSFSRYMDSWKRRNAAVSKNMKVPEALSVRWTELEASEPAMAQELSRIGTEATIERMTPSKALTAKERAEVSDVRLKKYDELRGRFQRLSPRAQKLYTDLSEYYRGVAKEESELLMSASLRGVLTKGASAPMTAEQYRDVFTREKIAEMNDAESITDALRDYVREEDLGDLVKEVRRMASLRTLGYGDYFPLMRYGDYVAYKEVPLPDETFDDFGEAAAARRELLDDDPTLDVSLIKKGDKTILRTIEKEFWMFESKTDAMNKANELGVSVEARIPREGDGSAISSNAALNTVLNSLEGNPAAQAAIKNHYLRSLSDQSFRKHELKRKNRAGVDYDIQHRNLANYMKQSAYYRAQLEHGWRMGEALQDMISFTRGRRDTPEIATEQLQQVVKQVLYRDQMTNDNTELNKLVRGGVNVTQFMMLTSPSYWMINASQPWLVTAPIMGGRYGYGNSYAALKDAFNLVKVPLSKEAWESKFGLKAFTDPVQTEKAFNVVDQLLDHIKNPPNGRPDPRAEQYVELIDELRDINIIDINVLTELRQIAEGTQGGAWTNTLDASRILAHITEVSNRTVTAIAAYNLAINDGQTVAEAKKYAADMVSQTQFNYSSENKPPLFQPGGPLKWAAPLMFQFMQWPQHMYALLIRNVRASVKGASAEDRAAARKSVLGLLGTHAAVGGIVGMALQPIKWAFGMAMFAFGDDDEPYTFANAISGRTFDNMIAEVMQDLFGDTMGRAVSHGLPTVIGTDLSARMSMGTLYFVDLRGDTAESALGSLAASFGGATLNQVMNWGNAMTKVARGDVFRGVEQASPKILRDALRSIRYYNEGLVNNRGDSVIPAKDLSFAEVFLQGIGFSPDEVSQFYSSQTAIKGAQGYARDRRDRLVNQFVEDGMNNEVMREVQQFNRAYPSMRITRSTLIRAARSRVERESRYERYGANIDEKSARDFADYGKPFN